MDSVLPIYSQPAAARKHLERLRWPKGPICPHCACKGNIVKLKGQSTRQGVYKCNDCRQPFSVTVGTVFEDSKIPLHQWVVACQLMAESKGLITPLELQSRIGITYKTAWLMKARLCDVESARAAHAS